MEISSRTCDGQTDLPAAESCSRSEVGNDAWFPYNFISHYPRHAPHSTDGSTMREADLVHISLVLSLNTKEKYPLLQLDDFT